MIQVRSSFQHRIFLSTTADQVTQISCPSVSIYFNLNVHPFGYFSSARMDMVCLFGKTTVFCLKKEKNLLAKHQLLHLLNRSQKAGIVV